MGKQSAMEKVSKETHDRVDHSIVIEHLGVWRLTTIKQPKFDPRRRWDDIVSGLQLFRRLIIEVFTISRTMPVLYILSKLWGGIESAVMLHLSSHLLQILETSIRDGKADTFPILMAIVSRLSCAVFIAALDRWTAYHNPAFKSRIIQYYQMHLMQARLDMDLSNALDPETQAQISPSDAWEALDTIVSFFGESLTFFSQLMVIVHASRFSGGPMFVLLCLARPLLRSLLIDDVWSKTWLMNLDHKDYQRMETLSALTMDQYRQDVITGNLQNHIMKEYKKAKKNLGDTCTDEFWKQLERRRSSSLIEIVSSVVAELPMVYCAANVIINPSAFSIASIAVLQESSLSLRYSLLDILRKMRSLHRHISNLRNLYTMPEKLSKISKGNVPYPSPESSTDGMAFELRDIVFNYPGSKNKLPALQNVSLTIKPGQLVVIVGANGSGKSTIIKLLTRLYDPNSGTLLIDGTLAQEYCPEDVRRTIASFTQDHNVYPLSLYENIAFGDVARSTDAAAVAAAAEQGGATEVIAKLVDGLDTSFQSKCRHTVNNIPDDPEHPLRKRLKMLPKEIDISGGEKQRVVAARTFMQLNSGGVKFVAVDEPTSALDPEGEYQLFDQLIASRAGKTMVFVTHRFGHLTKHADLIISMKDGGITESGSHEELMDLDGEYAKLYRIQANAFSDST